MAARFVLRSDFWKAGGPFIGPRGGKWADPEHKIPWKEPIGGAGPGGMSPSQWNTAGEYFQNLADKQAGHVQSHFYGLAAAAHHIAEGGNEGTAAQQYQNAVTKRGNPELSNLKEKHVLDMVERAKKFHSTAQGGEAPAATAPAAGVPEKPAGNLDDAVAQAKQLGAQAFAAGEHSAPGLNPGVTEMLKQHPGHEAHMKIMQAFSDAWMKANMAAPVPGVPEKPKAQAQKFGQTTEQVQAMDSEKHGAKFKVGDTIKVGGQEFLVHNITKFSHQGKDRFDVGLKKPGGKNVYNGVLYENGEWSSVVGMGGKAVVGASGPHKVAQPEGTAEEPKPAAAAPQSSGAPTFPGEALAAGDHVIVGKHKFEVVSAPAHDPHKSGILGHDYFNLKVKKPTGNKVFDATVRDAGGKPVWNVTDKGKQVVGSFSGGDEGHKKVSAETKAPKHEAVKQEAIGKANEHDIDAVPTAMSSAWHKRWSYGTQPEPVSASLNKMVASYLVRHDQKGMNAEDHMAAAQFHKQYGEDVMSGKKLPSLPHKTARSHRQQLHEALASFHEKMATNPDFVEKVYAIAGKKPKVKKSLSGIEGIQEYLENSRFEEIDMQKADKPNLPTPEKAPKEYREEGATERGDYADPKHFKYPLHTAANVRAAISYFSKPKNAGVYSTGEQKTIWGRIRAAAKKYGIEVGEQSGPPSVEKAFSGIEGIGNFLAKADKERADMAKDSLEKAVSQTGDYIPPPSRVSMHAQGSGQQIGGDYQRRWKGPSGKWLYEYHDPMHKAAIDASNATEDHKGTAGDLINAHQNASSAHLKAAEALKSDPDASAEHTQLAADHAKAAAVVHKNYFTPNAAPDQPQPEGETHGTPGAAPGSVPPPPALGAPPAGQPALKPVPKPGEGVAPAQTPPPGPKTPVPPLQHTPAQPGGPTPPAGAPATPPAAPAPDKKNPFQKSLDGIAGLAAYLQKAQDIPEGGPKQSLGVGEEQGGKVAGVGQVSGDGTSGGKQCGAPAVPQKKLSEDDEKDEEQMKPGKKPIETAKSMSVPAHQREMVAHEQAAAVSQLQKSDDVVYGLGVGHETPAIDPRPQAITWKQGRDGMISYSNRSDLEVDRLCKSDQFYQGDEPSITRVSPYISQQVRCPTCQSMMAKSLAVCPNCGEGAQQSLQKIVRTEEGMPQPGENRPGILRPARKSDVFYPGN